MEKRYAALRLIGTINQVLGVFTAVLSVLAVIGILAASLLGGAVIDSIGRPFGTEPGRLILFNNLLGGLLASAIVMLAGGLLAIFFYGIGEGLFLLLALEENTRFSNILLQRQHSLRAPVPTQEVVLVETEQAPTTAPAEAPVSGQEIPLESEQESEPEDERDDAPPLATESSASS